MKPIRAGVVPIPIHVLRLFLAATASCLVGGWALADAPWPTRWRNPLPQGNDIAAIAHGNGVFVAAGDIGTTLRSEDGMNWTVKVLPFTSGLNAITHGNGQFVLVGGIGAIFTSPNGDNWTRQSTVTPNTSLRCVGYGNGTFVAAGSGGTVITSTDGVNWTVRVSGTSATLRGVAFGNGTFVLVGDTGVILTSTDGVTWTARTSGTSGQLLAVTHGTGATGSMFVAVGSSGRVLVSNDGVTWNNQNSGTTQTLRGVTFADGFVAVGNASAVNNSTTIVTSNDGIGWVSRPASGTAQNLNAVQFGSGTFVAVGAIGTILTSADALAWLPRTSGLREFLYGVGYGNGTFVAVGANGTILTSSDGATWVSRPSGTLGFLLDVAYGNGRYVVLNSGGAILTSPDAITWTAGASVAGEGLTFGNGLFVAVGLSGAITTSPDGVAWTSRSSPVTNALFSVVFGNGMFVAVGRAGTVISSTDGINWTSRPAVTDSDLRGVTYGMGRFVAAGYHPAAPFPGIILSSSDAVNWSTTQAGGRLTEVSYGSGTFVAVGGPDPIFFSTDGVTWHGRNAGSLNSFGDVVHGNDTFVLVGAAGTILESEPISASRTVILAEPRSRSIAVGQTAIFEVQAAGWEPLFYQWQFNGAPLSGATQARLVLSNAQPAQAGMYAVAVSNFTGTVFSSVVTLTVLTPPAIVSSPASQAVSPGETVTLSVAASGSPPLSYQWQLNGVTLPGATNSSFAVANMRAANAGTYSVTVANEAGAARSAAAALTLNIPALPLSDNFAARGNSDAISGSGSGSNANATRESGEPNHGNKRGGKSVWFTWRAPGPGTVTFSTAGSAFDTILAVYTGTSLNSLTPVGADDDQGGFGTSSVAFTAESGVEYHLAVDGFAGAAGNLVLSWNFTFGDEDVPRIITAPASQVVTAGTNVTFTVGATARSAVVYQWHFKDEPLPGATGATLILTNAQPTNAGLYSVRVSSTTRITISPAATLEISTAPEVPSQDKFQDLFSEPGVQPQSPRGRRRSGTVSVAAGVLGTQVLDNFGAAKELDEPDHAGVIGGASRWFRLKADTDGVMVCSTVGSSIDTVLAVYTGTNLFDLRLVAGDDNSAPDGVRSLVRFAAVRNTDYVVAVDGVKGAQGKILLNWGIGQPPQLQSAPSQVGAALGRDFTLTAEATGTPAPQYQWLFNGFVLAGGTNASLVITNAQAHHAGSYRLALSNFVGQLVSDPFTVAVSAEPVVTLVAPTNNATFIAPGPISLSANATDTDGAITRVEFFAGTNSLGSVSNSPHTFVWTNVPPGTHTLSAKAIDNHGVSSASSTVSVTVELAPNQPPAVSLSAPTNNAVFVGPASITLSAEVTDTDGTIVRVEFFAGTNSLGVLTNGPFHFAWTNVQVGNYQLAAQATDDRGGTSTSTAVSVTVELAPNQPPAVSLSAPTNNAVFVGPASITLSAEATDADGTIVRVEFFAGTNSLGVLTNGPFHFAWTNVQVGNYSVSAKAMDDRGAEVASAGLNLVVINPEPPRITDWGRTNGLMRFQIIGAVAPSYIIEATTDLMFWSALATNSPAATVIEFVDPGMTNMPWRFYRVRLRVE